MEIAGSNLTNYNNELIFYVANAENYAPEQDSNGNEMLTQQVATDNGYAEPYGSYFDDAGKTYNEFS